MLAKTTASDRNRGRQSDLLPSMAVSCEADQCESFNNHGDYNYMRIIDVFHD